MVRNKLGNREYRLKTMGNFVCNYVFRNPVDKWSEYTALLLYLPRGRTFQFREQKLLRECNDNNNLEPWFYDMFVSSSLAPYY